MQDDDLVVVVPEVLEPADQAVDVHEQVADEADQAAAGDLLGQ